MAFPVPSLCFHSQKQKTFSPWHHAMETSWLRLLSSVSTAWDCVLFLITGEYHNSYTPVFVFSSCLSVIPSSYVDKKPYRSLALNLYIPIWPTMDSGERRKTGRLCETFSFLFFFSALCPYAVYSLGLITLVSSNRSARCRLTRLV